MFVVAEGFCRFGCLALVRGKEGHYTCMKTVHGQWIAVSERGMKVKVPLCKAHLRRAD